MLLWEHVFHHLLFDDDDEDNEVDNDDDDDDDDDDEDDKLFCGMVDLQKGSSHISRRDHHQQASPLSISNLLR